MQVRKIAGTVLIGGAMSAMALAGAGSAFASPYGPPGQGSGGQPGNTSSNSCQFIACNSSTHTVTVTKTNTATTGNVRIGNTAQNGGILNGNVVNPQVNTGSQSTGSVTNNSSVKKAGHVGVFQSGSSGDAVGNSSSTSTSVNNSSGNGNHNSVGNAG